MCEKNVVREVTRTSSPVYRQSDQARTNRRTRENNEREKIASVRTGLSNLWSFRGEKHYDNRPNKLNGDPLYNTPRLELSEDPKLTSTSGRSGASNITGGLRMLPDSPVVVLQHNSAFDRETSTTVCKVHHVSSRKGTQNLVLAERILHGSIRGRYYRPRKK